MAPVADALSGSVLRQPVKMPRGDGQNSPQKMGVLFCLKRNNFMEMAMLVTKVKLERL